METTVTLRPESQAFVEGEVRAGHYKSFADAIEAAVGRLMLDPPDDRLDAGDLAAIAESFRQIAAGQGIDLHMSRDEILRSIKGR